MEPVRVCSLIRQFSHDELVRSGVIPNLAQFTPAIEKRRYPSWIYRLNREGYENIYSDFGLFMEEIIATTLVAGKMDYADLWKKNTTMSVPEDLLKSVQTHYGPLIGWIKKMFVNETDVLHSHELTYETVEGHPDFFCPSFGEGTWILDAKNTCNFSKMESSAHMQILAYCALARASGHTSNYIGLILSMQRQIVWYDVTGWDSSEYLAMLVRESVWVVDDLSIRFQNIKTEYTGNHITKPGMMDPLFKQAHYPLQVFISNCHSKTYVTPEEAERMKGLMADHTRLFIHAPYIINLCSTELWPVEMLRNQLQAGAYMGAKGVVVHVGKYKNNGVDYSLDIMEQSIRKTLDVVDPRCPLLIETPAGEGTELCADINGFIGFISRFGNDPRLRICIDTCHVFAAGYDPVFYLQRWLDIDTDVVRLVHYNDSEKPRGCRVDRHARAGLSYVGFDRMWAVHEMCRRDNIPMVKE